MTPSFRPQTVIAAACSAALCVLGVPGCTEEQPPQSPPDASPEPSAAEPPAPEPSPAPQSAEALRARQMYADHCAACHGFTGHGDGPVAHLLEAQPRSLVDEPWRTIDAATPADERLQLEGVVRDGIETRGMPAFRNKLSDEQRAAIVGHVLAIRSAPEGP